MNKSRKKSNVDFKTRKPANIWNKTAGAIGRFGAASFTSIRNSSIDVLGEDEERFKFGNLKKRPKLSNTLMVDNAQSNKDPFLFGTSHNVMTGSPYQMTATPAPVVVKPRKFFKSRGPSEVGESIGKSDQQYPSSGRSSEIMGDIMIPPIKIPVPKPSKPKLKSQSSDKNLKTLRNATNVSPPTSQPIKLRIFKDKTTSKLVSVSEAPPPIINLEHSHATKPNKPEKIPKKRGRKPKNLLAITTTDNNNVSGNPVTFETPQPPPSVIEQKKPAGRLTRNSRKHQQQQDQQELPNYPQPLQIQSRTRTSCSSIEAMPILRRAESRDSTEDDNLGSENSSTYSSNIFLHHGGTTSGGGNNNNKVDSTSHNPSSSSINVIDNKKLEDDAEFQQLSQMLSSMEEGSDTDYNNSSFQQQQQQHNSLHHHNVLHSQQHHHHQHLQYNNNPQQLLYSNQQQQQQFPPDKLESLGVPTSTRSLVSMNVPLDIIPSTTAGILHPTPPPPPPPPLKIRDAQDIRAILEDDWDESFDEENSPKKSPPKTSRFDLSAFMHEGSSSSRSISPPNNNSSSSSAFLLNQAGQSSMQGHGTGMVCDYSQQQQHSYSHHQQHQQQHHHHHHHHPDQFVDHHHSNTQQLAPPFNAPYAVRNLLLTPQDFQQAHLASSNTNFHTHGDMSSAHQIVGTMKEEEDEILMKDESLESDKLTALNLSLTTNANSGSNLISSSSVALPSSSSMNPQHFGSTKKASIFKSRALAQTSGEIGCGDSNRGNPKKRLALYKHKFGGDGDEDEKARKLSDSTNHTGGSNNEETNVFQDDFDEDSDLEDLASMRRLASNSGGDSQSQETGGAMIGSGGSKVVCKKNTKKLFTVIRNVKPIHELQESGEFHEFDGDVWYILEDLKDKNPMTNRCLSAVSLAMRCMEPAFRMHLRAHGTVAEFCKELHDSPSHPVLALLASTVLFVLSQDRLNMDLDTDSLRLIIALTKAEQVEEIVDENPEILKHRQRVINLVSEMKNRGHAKHLKLEKITASELALETLLYLTSKRAGEWVKHELRNLGALHYIVTEVVTSLAWLRQEVVGVGWSEAVIERLWKIDRCLRVLQQVTFNHEENQRYLLGISTDAGGEEGATLKNTPEIFVTLFRFCSDQLAMLPKETESATVIREILFSVLRVLVNLSHDYRGIVLGSEILCRLDGFLQLCLHSVFHLSSHIPDEKIFDLLMHSLCMLLNLVEHSRTNRSAILSSTVRRQMTTRAELLHSSWSTSDSGLEEQPTLDALVEMFVAKERAAKQDEASTDDILTKGSDSQKDSQGKPSNSQSSSQNSQNSTESESTNSVQDTIDKLIQTAGKHMENSLIAAYVSLLLAYLIMDDPVSAETVRNSMPNCKYLPLMIVLKKLFNFMSITSSASGSLRGLKATAIALKFYAKCDPNSNDELKKIIPD